jgi:hypothetical protein
MAPFFLFHFVAVPAPFFLFGGAQLGSVVLANMVLAEVASLTAPTREPPPPPTHAQLSSHSPLFALALVATAEPQHPNPSACCNLPPPPHCYARAPLGGLSEPTHPLSTSPRAEPQHHWVGF